MSKSISGFFTASSNETSALKGFNLEADRGNPEAVETLSNHYKGQLYFTGEDPKSNSKTPHKDEANFYNNLAKAIKINNSKDRTIEDESSMLKLYFDAAKISFELKVSAKTGFKYPITKLSSFNKQGPQDLLSSEEIKALVTSEVDFNKNSQEISKQDFSKLVNNLTKMSCDNLTVEDLQSIKEQLVIKTAKKENDRLYVKSYASNPIEDLINSKNNNSKESTEETLNPINTSSQETPSPKTSATSSQNPAEKKEKGSSHVY